MLHRHISTTKARRSSKSAQRAFDVCRAAFPARPLDGATGGRNARIRGHFRRSTPRFFIAHTHTDTKQMSGASLAALTRWPAVICGSTCRPAGNCADKKAREKKCHLRVLWCDARALCAWVRRVWWFELRHVVGLWCNRTWPAFRALFLRTLAGKFVGVFAMIRLWCETFLGRSLLVNKSAFFNTEILLVTWWK